MNDRRLSREEILIDTIWEKGKIYVYSPVFEKKVPFYMLHSDRSLEHIEHSISDRLVLAVNDFLSLPLESKVSIGELLYQHCLECCEGISYGVDVREHETETAANLREFGISNREDAFEKANLSQIMYVEEDSFRKNRFVTILFYPEWESEHGCELILKNGELLNFVGENGTYLGQFDD